MIYELATGVSAKAVTPYAARRNSLIPSIIFLLVLCGSPLALLMCQPRPLDVPVSGEARRWHIETCKLIISSQQKESFRHSEV